MQFYSATILVSIFMFSFATSMTPGPNNIMLLSSGLTFGYKKTLPHIVGVVLGFPFMTVCVGMGLGKFFQQYSALFLALKYVGILYLLWLAWHISKSKPQLKENNANSKPLSFF